LWQKTYFPVYFSQNNGRIRKIEYRPLKTKDPAQNRSSPLSAHLIVNLRKSAKSVVSKKNANEPNSGKQHIPGFLSSWVLEFFDSSFGVIPARSVIFLGCSVVVLASSGVSPHPWKPVF
jgi:hypothetical protein